MSSNIDLTFRFQHLIYNTGQFLCACCTQLRGART